MKTKEELNRLKTEYAAMNEKLAELSDNELEQVTGGTARPLFQALNQLLQRPIEIPNSILQNTTSQNTANSGTEGYSRQQVNSLPVQYYQKENSAPDISDIIATEE